MSRKKFGQLLQKYLRGDCTPEEKAFVEYWYGLLETETGKPVVEPDMDELEGKLWNQIQRGMDTDAAPEQGRVVPLRTARYRWLGIAASLLLVGYAVLVQWPIRQFVSSGWLSSPSGPAWAEQTNTTQKPVTIRLDDGSSVQLSARSTLRFPKHFSPHDRTVYLTGDAFFSIQKMPSRPFYVHTGTVITRVLGTSFYIRTKNTDKQVRVEVVTGRVAVYEQPKDKKTGTNGVVLKPNQATTFFVDKQRFVTGLVDAPQLIEPAEAVKKQPRFQFDDTPLSEVLAQLEQAYGIEIKVENARQNTCPLTADLTNQPLTTQLEIICAALKATYKVQGTTILLSGKGCH